jgi:CRISPR-associated protein Cas1
MSRRAHWVNTGLKEISVMPALYLTEQGSFLRCEGERLVIEHGGRTIFGVPVLQVERVLAFGNVQLSTQVLGLLLSRGIEVSFLTVRGRLKGRLVPTVCKNITLRRAQYGRACDESFAVELARVLVAGKIRNGRAVLGRYGRNHSEHGNDEADDEGENVEAALSANKATGLNKASGLNILKSGAGKSCKAKPCESKSCGVKPCQQERSQPALAPKQVQRQLRHLARQALLQESVTQLLGVEGHAAHIYFQGFSAMLRQPEMSFDRRTRHPPRDPVNALLSLGYTLAGNELHGVTTALGLDPWMGFLHGVSERRPGLPMDLLEEFRAPLVDRFTAALINRRVLDANDFEAHPKGGVTLKQAALKRYLLSWEKNLNRPFKYLESGQQVSFRRLFHLQAQAMAHAIESDEPYQPYEHRW